MSVKTVEQYTCDRCEDTWESTDKDFNKNTVFIWSNLASVSEVPMIIGSHHLCVQCSKDLGEWISTLPQSKPTEMGDLEMKQIPSCASCQHYTKPTPALGVCARSLQAVSPDYYCPFYESKT